MKQLHRLYIALAIIFFPCCSVFALADANTILQLDFANTLNGAQGETPTAAVNTAFQSGIQGLGARLSDGGYIAYPSANNINTTEGTLSLWIKPNWIPSTDAVVTRTIMQYGDFLFSKEYDNLRLLISGYGVTATNISSWHANEWHHLVFTWSNNNNSVKLYIDGELVNSNVLVAPIPLTMSDNTIYFGKGSNVNDTTFLDATIDQVEISDKERTAQEIRNSLFSSLTINSLSFSPTSMEMMQSWTVVHIPEVLADTNIGSLSIPVDGVTWASSDTSVATIDANGVITGANQGSTQTINITATLNNVVGILPVTVKAPALPMSFESIDSFEATSAQGSLFEIPVVVINFLPTSDGINIDQSVIDWDTTVDTLKQRLLGLRTQMKFMSEESSRFRGYANMPSPPAPALGYRIVSVVNIYEEMPSSKIPTLADYNQILTRVGAENFVRNQGVKEFWIWGYHTDKIAPVESNMSVLPSTGTGDISNSAGYTDDLPIYDHTYLVYNFNFTRNANLHNQGHQFENFFDYESTKQDGNRLLFAEKFAGRTIADNVFHQGRAGDTHDPSNARWDYDYYNTNYVNSDITNWTPEELNTKIPFNADTFNGVPYSFPNNEMPAPIGTIIEDDAKWYMFWRQSLPGWNNTIPYHNPITTTQLGGTGVDSRMTNWWQFAADWDAANRADLGLYEPADCKYSIVAHHKKITAKGGSISVAVRIKPKNSACKWIAVSNQPTWIKFKVDAGSNLLNTSANDNRYASFQVLPNTSTNPRNGTVVIANQVFTVKQAGVKK